MLWQCCASCSSWYTTNICFWFVWQHKSTRSFFASLICGGIETLMPNPLIYHEVRSINLVVSMWVWHESLGASTKSEKQKRNVLIYVVMRIRRKCWNTRNCGRHSVLKTWRSPILIKLCLKIHWMYECARVMQTLLSFSTLTIQSLLKILPISFNIAI